MTASAEKASKLVFNQSIIVIIVIILLNAYIYELI